MSQSKLIRGDATWVRVMDGVRCSYKFRVSLPCAGLDGPGRSLMESGVPTEHVNITDWNDSLAPVLKKLHGDDPSRVRIANMLGLDFHTLEDSEGLVSGPPCQPCSALGLKMRRDDPRFAGVSKRFNDCALPRLQGLRRIRECFN